MAQYFFRTVFKGTRYHGWQIQENARTVQGEVNQALCNLFGSEEARTLGCGRTDKGVHASDFYFSYQSDEAFDKEELCFRMNRSLAPDIAIRSIHRVHDDAHVRFDPDRRTYEYRIHRAKDPFSRDRSYFLERSLDIGAMQEATKLLHSYEHFGAFKRSGGSQRSDRCKVERAEWELSEDGERLTFRISADRFLRGMVRGIVGTLLDVGVGRYGRERFQEIIESRDREEAGKNVPPEGLFLTEVRFPYALGP